MSDNIEDLLFSPIQELDQELRDRLYVRDGITFVKHPLVISMFHIPEMNALLNRQLRTKKAMLEKARLEQNWHQFVFLHERPWRVDAFKLIMESLSHEEYGKLLASIWIDSENIRENQATWDWLLHRDGATPFFDMMSEEEQRRFRRLPETVEVFQGCTIERDDGWSWTLSKQTALWFAKRFADLERSKPKLRTTKVCKDHIKALLTARGEEEVLIDPTYVEDHLEVTETSSFGSQFMFPRRP